MIGLEAQGLRDLRGASETLTNNSRLFPMWVISVDNFLELDAAGPASVRINMASTSSFRTFRIFTLGPGHQKAEELRPHQELLAAGKICEYERGTPAMATLARATARTDRFRIRLYTDGDGLAWPVVETG